MIDIHDALTWSGRPIVSLFVVTPRGSATPVELEDVGHISSIRTYDLEDVANVLPGLDTREYDLTFEVLPEALDALLTEVLRRACSAGARVAWLGFEGSFNFKHILTPDIADQIYGVCTEGADPALELDDHARAGAEWLGQVSAARGKLH